MLSCVYFKGQLDYVRFKNQELILCGDNDLTKRFPGHSEGLLSFFVFLLSSLYLFLFYSLAGFAAVRIFIKWSHIVQSIKSVFHFNL